jgi:hypothetical protein
LQQVFELSPQVSGLFRSGFILSHHRCSSFIERSLRLGDRLYGKLGACRQLRSPSVRTFCVLVRWEEMAAFIKRSASDGRGAVLRRPSGSRRQNSRRTGL